MSATSIFGGRILPTLQPYPTIHPASPPVAPQTAWRTGRDSHLCCDLLYLSRRKTWVFDSAWFDCGFINSHGCYPLLATLTYLKFQLDAQLPLANKDVDMLKTPLIFDTHGEAFFWTNSAASNPNGSQTHGVRHAAGLKFCEPSEEHPNPAWGCSCMWLYLFIYIWYMYVYIYIYIF